MACDKVYQGLCTVTAENTQQNSNGEDELVMYNASIKALNTNKKKDLLCTH